MAVRSNQAGRSGQNLVDKPDRLGPALAQVVYVDADKDVILGQAWLAAVNQLVTCGHVVETFATNPGGLFVYFPSSGKRYPVRQVRLHPNFVRQPDGLVKFDAAVMTVQLTAPDSMALPLPFTYEQPLKLNEPLWTIRYPVHLGQYSASAQPLSQDGRFLGSLGKNDSYHLLHDVPLAPGDSGSPITDGQVVVAIHCGDTATLPGLNLPTTSIRLSLWIDALRELGLAQTRQSSLSRRPSFLPAVIAFVVAAGVSCGAAHFYFTPKPKPVIPFAQSPLGPLRVSFNQAPDKYEPSDTVEVTIGTASPCYPFLFLVTQDVALRMFPLGTSQVMDVGHDKIIDEIDRQKLTASKIDMDLLALAVSSTDREAAKWATEVIGKEPVHPKSSILTIKAKQLLDKISKFQAEHPSAVAFHIFKIKATK